MKLNPNLTEPTNKNNPHKVDEEKIYQEVVDKTKEFTEFTIDGLFVAAESNKLLQKQGEKRAGTFSKNQKVKNEAETLNELKKLQMATEMMNKQLKAFLA